MAQIRLGRFEVQEHGLPLVCMICGAPSTTTRSKHFSWYPPWVPILVVAGLLPYLLIAMLLTKRMWVFAPFCDQHKNHWFSRNLISGLVVTGVLLVGVFNFVLLVNMDEMSEPARSLMGQLCLFTVLLLLGWVVLQSILHYTSIRPTEITDRTITLTRVSEGFVQAVEQQRDEEDEERWQERRSPRRRYEDDDYEPPPRPIQREPSDRIQDPEARRPMPPDQIQPGER